MRWEERALPNAVQAASPMQLLVTVQRRRAPATLLQQFISAGYYMRHPTKASGCLDWSTLSLPTGHRDMRSKRETTVRVQPRRQKHKQHTRRLLERTGQRTYFKESRSARKPSRQTLLSSHCYYQGTVKQVEEWPHQKSRIIRLTSGRRSRWHKCSAQALP